jgi:hypothetical protein
MANNQLLDYPFPHKLTKQEQLIHDLILEVRNSSGSGGAPADACCPETNTKLDIIKGILADLTGVAYATQGNIEVLIAKATLGDMRIYSSRLIGQTFSFFNDGIKAWEQSILDIKNTYPNAQIYQSDRHEYSSGSYEWIIYYYGHNI